MAKLPRHGTIGKNHISSRSSSYRICFFICSKYDTFLKDFIISCLICDHSKRTDTIAAVLFLISFLIVSVVALFAIYTSFSVKDIASEYENQIAETRQLISRMVLESLTTDSKFST